MSISSFIKKKERVDFHLLVPTFCLKTYLLSSRDAPMLLIVPSLKLNHKFGQTLR
jgi:hypothetical protein